MNTISSTLTKGFAVALFIILFASPASAQSEKQCVCHNVLHNPVEICTDDDSFKVGHEGHIENGSDILGACPVDPTATPTPTGSVIEPTTPPDEPPAVPEFGMLTGLSAFAVSAGSYFMLKRKA